MNHLSARDQLTFVWITATNVLAFLAFALDKFLATHNHRRVPVNFLLLIAAFGGWPGGLLAMNLFRHKTAKLSFKVKYALALIPFAAGIWAWWHWR